MLRGLSVVWGIEVASYVKKIEAVWRRVALRTVDIEHHQRTATYRLRASAKNEELL